MDDWPQIESLFEAALQREPAEREAFIRATCAHDDALCHELLSLLAHDAGSTQEVWAPAAAAHLLVQRAHGSDPQPDLTTGTQLGPYTIAGAIGSGAMGHVHRALDSRLHRDVAIKTLPRVFSQDSPWRARLHREARMLAAVNHPNIAGIYDLLEVGGSSYLVLEYVEGPDLSERLRDGPLPLAQAVTIAHQIALALKAAHDSGIVHRDLKPANIKMTPDGRVKVLDFGIAMQIADITSGDHETALGTGLRTVRAGTPAYMSPEQALGRQVDHRADIWAFGCVLFELLTGTRAFDIDGRSGTVAAMLKGSPDLARLPRGTPPRVVAAIKGCLERDVTKRIFDADTVLKLLPAVSGAPRIRGRVWAGAAIGLIIVAAFATRAVIGGRFVGQPVNPGGDALANSPPLVVGDVRQLTADEFLAIDPAISPDGRFVAYSAGNPSRMRAFIRPIAGGPAVAVAPDEGGSQLQPRWSPDGRRLLYVTPDAVFLARPPDRRAIRLYDATDFAGSDTQSFMGTGRGISGAVWSPDGRTIVVAHGRVLRRIGSEPGGVATTLAESPFELHSCDWSARTTWIACASGNWHFAGPGGRFGNLAPSAIALVPESGGRVIEITDRTAHNKSPVWSGDGRRLFFLSNRQGTSDVYVVDVNADGSAPRPPLRVTTGLGAQSIALSPDRQTLAYAAYSARANVWSVPIPESTPVDASRAVATTFGNQIVETVRVSLDGKWLLYDSNLHGNADIFRVPISGGPVEQLTSDPADEFAPDLSPDGNWVAYHSWKTKSRDIFVSPIGAGTPQQITASEFQESYPFWSPDGQSIVFADQFVENGIARGAYQVRRDSAGKWSTPIRVRAALGRVTWTPDARQLVATVDGGIDVFEPGTTSTHVLYRPLAGSDDPRVEGPLADSRGTKVYFKSHDADGRAFLWSIPMSGGRPTLLVRIDDLSRPSGRSDFAVSDSRFFFTLDERQSNIWIASVTNRPTVP